MFLQTQPVQYPYSFLGMKRKTDETHDSVLAFDWTEGNSPSVAVVEAVAALHDDHADGLPPLYRYVDTDSLDTLLDHQQSRSVEGLISFEYDGHRVILASDGDGRVYETVESG